MFARKKYKIVHDERMGSPTTTRGPINCSMCALCREQSDKTLICPVKSNRTDIGAGYDTWADNLSSFRSVGNEPLPIDINMLDKGDGICNTLTRNHAKWHASCCLKCCVSRIARLVQTSQVWDE